MTSHVKRFVKACHSCQVNKPSNTAPAGPLQPLPVPSKPWESVSLDFITALPKTNSGYDAIVVFVDRLTKMVHFVPTHTSATAQQTARLFLQSIFRQHGMPRSLISDRDSKFTSDFWQSFFTTLGTTLNLSTSYHPQSDGQTERMNRTLEQVLRHFVNIHHNDWDDFLPLAEFAMNNSTSATTTYTPFYLNSGQTPHTPLTLVAPLPPDHELTPAAEALHERWRDALEHAQVSMRLAQESQARHADTRRTPAPVFQPGDKVLLSSAHIDLRNMPSAKFKPRFIGPFKVDRQISQSAYRLKLPRDLKIHPVFHVSLLKPYVTDPINPPPPLPLEPEPESDDWEVEQILDKRITRSKPFYLCRFKGHTAEEDDWLSPSDLTACNDLVNAFELELARNAPPPVVPPRRNRPALPAPAAVSASTRPQRDRRQPVPYWQSTAVPAWMNPSVQ